MLISGNTILITGATSGIGLALTKKFLSLNNTVIGLGRNLDELKKLGYPGMLWPIKCDLRDKEKLKKIVEEISNRHPQLNILINNAGIQYNYTLKEPIPELEIQEEIDINFSVPVWFITTLLPVILKQKKAAIINITTSLALAPKLSAPVYCAAKAGLKLFTRAMRYRLEGTGTTIIDITPPLVDTAMTRGRGVGKISPDIVAQKIIAGLERDRAEIYIGKARLLYLIMKFIPSLGYRIMKDK